jgi:hypothetical protein
MALDNRLLTRAPQHQRITLHPAFAFHLASVTGLSAASAS